jgi:hypothetical protein
MSLTSTISLNIASTPPLFLPSPYVLPSSSSSYSAASHCDRACCSFIALTGCWLCLVPSSQRVHAEGGLVKKAAWTTTDQYGAVLAIFVYDDAPASMSSLLEFQRFFGTIGFPKGVLEATFHRLYENDVLPEDAFVAWKDRVDGTEDKKVALIQLAR